MDELLCSMLHWVDKYIYDIVNNNVPLQTVALNFRPTCFQSIMPIPVSAECRRQAMLGMVLWVTTTQIRNLWSYSKAGHHYRSSNWKNSCFKGQHSNSYLCEWYGL